MSIFTANRAEQAKLAAADGDQNGATARALISVGERFKQLARAEMYKYDPFLWAKERLGLHLWSMQKAIAESVRDNKKTVVKSCHDSGKTYLAAILVCWWIDTHPADQTRVVTTAPTANQVIKIMWEYIRKLHNTYGLSGDVSEAAEWKSDPDRYTVGQGRKPADTNQHALQGIHAPYVFVIIDEACGVPEQLWTSAEAITTNPDNRIMAIGNPDDPATEFGRIFNSNDPSWSKYTISAFDTPNFTEEHWELPDGMAKALLERDWVTEKEISWGKDSSRYRSKVLAEFPKESVDTFFSPYLLNSGYDNRPIPQHDDRPRLGVDVARFGDDMCTVVMYHGGVLTVLDAWDKTDTVDTARRVHNLAVLNAASEVRVDATGIGVGVVDQLRRLCTTYYRVIEMVGSAASPDINRWYNYRAYIHDYFREQLARGTLQLPEPKSKHCNEKVLYEELEGLRYKFLRGAILIESKDDMRRRNVKSPDFSDAAMYAVAPVDFNDPTTHHAPGEEILLETGHEDWMIRGYGLSPV